MIAKEWFGLVSIVPGLIGYGSYIRSVLLRRTKPHFFSWGVWTLLMGIVFLAQMRAGAGPGGWITGISAAACLVIATLALFLGEKNVTRSDWVAFLGALAIIPLWRMTENALLAVILATAIDGLAYYPTLRKSWAKPHEEAWFTYALDCIKWIIAFGGLEQCSAVTLIYPVFLLGANATLVATILGRRVALAKG